MGNRHPVDELAEIRKEKRRLTGREDALRLNCYRPMLISKATIIQLPCTGSDGKSLTLVPRSNASSVEPRASRITVWFWAVAGIGYHVGKSDDFPRFPRLDH